MCDEDVTDDRQWHIGKHQLPRDAVAAINHVRGVVRDDNLRGPGTDFSRPRTTTCPEENESGTSTLSREGSGTRRASTSDRRRQKFSTGDGRQFAVILSAVARTRLIVPRGRRFAKSCQDKHFDG